MSLAGIKGKRGIVSTPCPFKSYMGLGAVSNLCESIKVSLAIYMKLKKKMLLNMCTFTHVTEG